MIGLPMPDPGGVVVPFVNGTNNRGDYDDLSFFAGFEAGSICARLYAADEAGVRSLEEIYVRVDNMKQIDLIAMHFGWILHDLCEEHRVDPSGTWWTTIALRRPNDDDDL